MELSSPEIVKQGNRLHVKHGDDSGLFVEFFKKPVEMKSKSKEAGRPIFEEIDYIRIRPVGQNQTVVERKVRMEDDYNTPSDPARFSRQWQAFQNQQEQSQEGTPLEQWPPITKSKALELKALGMHTVEAVAAMSDANLYGMGARELRDQAKSWLEMADNGAAATQWQAEKEKLESKIAALELQIKAPKNKIFKKKSE